MTVDQAIEAEMAAYRNARAAHQIEAAWQALARVHILSQTRIWPHIRSHIEMLGFAVAMRDGKEVFGQMIRLVLAPLGNITGPLPLGNTGRANVSAFAPMEIPEDLAGVMNKKRNSK